MTLPRALRPRRCFGLRLMATSSPKTQAKQTGTAANSKRAARTQNHHCVRISRHGKTQLRQKPSRRRRCNQQNVGVLKDGSILFTVVPDGYKVSSLENMLVQPTRKRGTVSVTDSGGFITYMNRHCEDGTLVYADIDQSLRVVQTGWRHQRQFDRRAWVARPHMHDGQEAVYRVGALDWSEQKVTSQADFASWIEDNLDIAATDGMPTGGDMLAMAFGFERTSEKRLKSKFNLQSGSFRLEYIEDEDKGHSHQFEVFSRFSIGIPVFENSTSAYQIDARLKYRESSGEGVFLVELIRPDKAFRQP